MNEFVCDIDITEIETNVAVWYALPECIDGDVRGTFREITTSEIGQDKNDVTDHNRIMKIEMTSVGDWEFYITYYVYDGDVVIGIARTEIEHFLTGGRYSLDYENIGIVEYCDYFDDCFNKDDIIKVMEDLKLERECHVYWLNDKINDKSLSANIIRATIDILRKKGKAVYSVRLVTGAMSGVYDNSELEALYGKIDNAQSAEFNCSLSVDTGVERLWINVTGDAVRKVWTWPNIFDDNNVKERAAIEKINTLVGEWLDQNAPHYGNPKKIDINDIVVNPKAEEILNEMMACSVK